LGPPAGEKREPPGPEWFTVQRELYNQRPFLTQTHLISSSVFILLASFQFSAKFRKSHLKWHRRLGRLFLCTTPFVAGSGLVLGAVMPFGGKLETFYAVLLFTLVLLAAFRGITNIRNHRVVQHRAWMIRLFAWSMSIATMRIVLGAFYQIQPWSDREWFANSLLIALALNAVVAEWWIKRKKGAMI
jgi:uncharacterized membrane protein